jgi:hypothetical protein
MMCSTNSRWDLLAFGRADPQRLQEQVALDAQVAPGHDVVDDAHALEQGQVLEGAGDAHGGHLAAVHVAEGLTLEADAALLRRVDTVDAVQHRTLARAVGPDDGPDLVLAHIERDVGQGLDATERQADVLHVQDHIPDQLATGLRRETAGCMAPALSVPARDAIAASIVLLLMLLP